MTSRRRQLGLALIVPALALPLAGSPAQAYTPPAPPARSLPSGLDVAVPYQGQTICDPHARPGVLSFATLMTKHYGMGSTALIGRTCASDVSEHYDGRAWDWMLNVANPDQEAVAQSVLTWLTAPDAQGRPGAMARRFGIMYIIHNRKMWRAYAPERGWAAYYGVSPHTDHIHFSFTYDGAAGRTSWWTGVATTSYLTSLPPVTPPAVIPVPTSPGVLSYGMTSEAVRQLQSRLGSLPTTGYFGPMTKARVIEYQRFVGLPQTGVADLTTQKVLAERGWSTTTAPVPTTYPTLSYGMTSEAVRRLQEKLGSLPTTAWFGPMTQDRVKAYQKFMGLSVTGVADSRTQELLFTKGWSTTTTASFVTPDVSGRGAVMTALAPAMAADFSPAVSTVSTTTGYTGFKSTVLAEGSRGPAVRALQRGLGGMPVDGAFGPLTTRKVAALQRSQGLPETGVVTADVWDVLEQRDYPFIDNRTRVLRVGDVGTEVTAVQQLLGVPLTGTFDLPTRAAVKAAQAKAGLASTGVIASRTWTLFDRLSA